MRRNRRLVGYARNSIKKAIDILTTKVVGIAASESHSPYRYSVAGLSKWANCIID